MDHLEAVNSAKRLRLEVLLLYSFCFGESAVLKCHLILRSPLIPPLLSIPDLTQRNSKCKLIN